MRLLRVHEQKMWSLINVDCKDLKTLRDREMCCPTSAQKLGKMVKNEF